MKRTKIFLTEAEWQVIVDGLNKLRTNLIKAGSHTDVVDDAMAKVITAPVKTVRA